MKYCHNCGKELADDMSFCHDCGTKVVVAHKATCPNCGGELGADADFCPWCGRNLRLVEKGSDLVPEQTEDTETREEERTYGRIQPGGKKGGGAKYVFLFLGILAVVVGVVIAYDSWGGDFVQEYITQEDKSPAPVLVPKSRNLVNATINVSPDSYYRTSFSVSSDTMRDVRVVGSFRASGGSGNDIRVYIMDEMAFTNWANGHEVNTLYSSGKITTDNIDVAIRTSDRYYLVFSNTFSTFSSKDVWTRVDLKWSELEYR